MTSDRERWNARYRDPRTRVSDEPNPYLVSQATRLTGGGRAIDVAGGAGANARWLDARGYDVTLADVSDVALDRASSPAGITLLQIDLEREPFPVGPWSLVFVANYLWRPLYAAAGAALAPGGLLVVVHPTRRNLERHARPSERFLLEDGELPGLVGDLEILDYVEGWESDRHEARLVARSVAP